MKQYLGILLLISLIAGLVNWLSPSFLGSPTNRTPFPHRGRADFELIASGMRHTEVAALLGGPPFVLTSAYYVSSGIRVPISRDQEVIGEWHLEEGIVLVAFDRAGTVCGKAFMPRVPLGGYLARLARNCSPISAIASRVRSSTPARLRKPWIMPE